MKSIVLLLAIVGAASALRPDAVEVITTFKDIAPRYKAALDQEESALVSVKSNVSTQLVNFHLDVINSKEVFVDAVVEREDYILGQIARQTEADTVCLGFVKSSSEMTVNLAGVSFTNCINAADLALNTKLTDYSGSLGRMASQLSQLRLLDVFRGDNIFYTPARINQKLNEKLLALQENPALSATEIEALVEAVSQDLGGILNTYNTCMTGASTMAEQGLSMCVTQMTVICGAVLQDSELPQ
ncbi:uncharacterized protein LOC125952408 [Anopheles darlingi]|uniref:uncharacterized protein LOC125952408 n=1 Tax=Anopheles darlingi TaxID=43151 RepID=UPI00210022B6|nr:uncharacterized protein LOC125952408 [Anopheles darlingi]